MTTTAADVATMALEAVMRGEVDEARDLIGQLDGDERMTLHEYVLKLHRVSLLAKSDPVAR